MSYLKLFDHLDVPNRASWMSLTRDLDAHRIRMAVVSRECASNRTQWQFTENTWKHNIIVQQSLETVLTIVLVDGMAWAMNEMQLFKHTFHHLCLSIHECLLKEFK